MTTTDGGRFRADLVDLAWGEESSYGKNPRAGADAITAIALTDSQTTIANELWGQWGLVTGGVDLPTPAFQWTPFFGLGVLDRNMMFPVQGRESLEGSIGGILFCHDSSRLFMEQCLGLAFNGANSMNAAGDGAASGVTALTYTPTTGSISMTQTATDITLACSGDDYSTVKPASASVDATHIVIFNDLANTEPDRYKDPWAYVGYDSTATEFKVFRDRDQTQPGWIGPTPPITSSASTQQYSFHSIERTTNSNTNHYDSVNHNKAEGHGVIIRPTLIQPSFMMAARFRADDGSTFVTNYKGCKVARTVFSFEEGNPVTYSADYIAREFRHNIGQDDASGSNTKTSHYAALQTSSGADTESNLPVVVPPNKMDKIRVTEQPYFFSRVSLTFHGSEIARFRSFSLTIDNQLDPRYYITQNDAEVPRAGRQVLHEILEGRRNITFSGSLDLDNDGTNSYPASSSPTDAIFLRYLLNQGFTDTDIRDQATLKGLSIKIELRRTSAGTPGGAATSFGYDKVFFYLPSAATSSTTGSQDDVGMVLRAVSNNIPGPPSIHIPVDIDGFCSSMHMEFLDNVPTAAQTWA